MEDLYNFDANRFFDELDRWIERHHDVTHCSLRPIWKVECIRLEYCRPVDYPVLDIAVELDTTHDREVLHVTRHSSAARGDFELSYHSSKRFDAEALTYAYLTAAFLQSKGIETVIRPTVDGLAKLKSFVETSNTF